MALSTDLNPATLLSSTITTIVITTEHGEKEYVVHKDLLCDKSAYFATAYRTSRKGAAEDRFEINHWPDTAMRSLITWLYTGKVYLEPGEAPPLEVPAVEPSGAGESGEGSTGHEEKAPAAEDDDGFDDGNDHDGSYSDGSPTDNDDYSAMYDGMDFEYEEEPEDVSEEEDELSPENMSGNGVAKIRVGVDQENDAKSKQWPSEEATHVGWISPECSNVSDLDAYRLSVLIRMAEMDTTLDWPYLESWKQRLEGALALPAPINDAGVDVYDRLFDLYILGDRLDIQDLRIKITDLVDAYQGEQYDLLGGQTLPSLRSVSKVCENLISGCPLRVWLVHLYAWDWYAVIDHPEKIKLYDDLPRDFLLEVMSVMSQKSQWGWTDENFPKYQDLCICHDYDFEDEEKRREMKGEPHPVNEFGFKQNKLRQ